ncbi:MAG: UDP binding domain-containing protein, partial [Bacillota bacterium]
LPKDLSGLLYLAGQAGKKALLLKAIHDVNAGQPVMVVEKAEKLLGSLKDKKIAVWGLAFKPETDDMRFAPAIPVISLLLSKQVHVSAYDPVAAENAKKLLPVSVDIYDDMYETVRDCDALIIMTEWSAFAQADLELLRDIMKQPVVIDARNIYSPADMKARGFVYSGIGRR